MFNSLKEIKFSMWLFFSFFTGLFCLLSLPRKAAGCVFGVTDVLSFPLPTRETCCPGELHLPLALFTLCKLSLSLTFGQTCSRTQLSWLVKFHSRAAALSKEREHPSVGAFFSPLCWLCCQMCFWRKIVSQTRRSHLSLWTRHLQGPKRNAGKPS